MKRIAIAAITTFIAVLSGTLYAADPKPPAPAAAPSFPPPTDEDLQKIIRMPCRIFPWIANPPPKPPEATSKISEPNAGGGASIDLSSGDIIVKALGEFAYTDGPQPGKQLLTLNKQVEIEQIATKSVMRAEKFRIIIDQASGNTDLIEANGDVQFVQPPDQKGRCEQLIRETKFGTHGEPLKDMTTLEGNHATHSKATVWQGANAIEAERIMNDGRMNTFRALGSPAAVVTTGDDTGAAGAAPSTGPMAAPKPAGTSGVSMMPGIGLSSGGVVRMQCDGELYYEGASGRVNLTRNVLIQQGDPKVINGPAVISIASDDAHLVLDLPPMGQPDSGGKLFSGTPKSLVCIGRVEIKTSTHTILCDRGTFDLLRNSFLLEMKNPKEEVTIYVRESPTSGQTMLIPRSLSGNTASNDFKSASGMRYGVWPAVIPTNRPALPKSTEKP